jgi:hypothetical protein
MSKKISLVLVVALVTFMDVRSCPICGCGGSNIYMGLMPEFSGHFIGIRYHYSRYHTQLLNDLSQFSTNEYNTLELWGGLKLGNKFQLLGFVPYYFNKQIDDDGSFRTKGLGDITLIGQYKLYESAKWKPGNRILRQQVWVGGGLKLPTGPFNANLFDSTTTVSDINAQIGTGSVDFLVNGLYTLTVQRFGINLSANYKINMDNSQGYKYGNKLSMNLISFYRIGTMMNNLAPNVGVGYENIATNTFQLKSVPYTGSKIMTGIVGVEYHVRKVGIGINAQIPIVQEFAEGQTRMQISGMAHLTVEL